ncbi:MAG: hypothetical protein M1833_001270, partial [Piccolia ochrophora]
MAASSNVNSSRSPVSPDSEVPSSILIVGAGVFGLSTALALSNNPRYANTKLTLIDRSPVPVPDGSSVDTSRIIRADYSDRAYASLAASAQSRWRGAWGDDGRYTESGLVLTGESSSSSAPPPYVRKSHANVCSLSASPETDIQLLPSPAAIAAASATGGAPHGSWGYLNRRSGWADAEASIRYAHSLLLATQRVTILTDTVSRLLFSAPPASPAVTGAVLATTDERITADLTILATGAWTPTLVDLRGRVTATGQILAYTAVSPAEEASWGSIP